MVDMHIVKNAKHAVGIVTASLPHSFSQNPYVKSTEPVS